MQQEPLRPLEQQPASGPTSAPAPEADAGPSPRLSLLRGGGTDAGAPDAASTVLWAQIPSTGVQACDTYIHRYITCVQSKMPPNTRDIVMKSLVTMVQAWRKAAATPSGRKGLAQACQTAMQTAKKTMQGFGCQW
jgi:hypothetical protein